MMRMMVLLAAAAALFATPAQAAFTTLSITSTNNTDAELPFDFLASALITPISGPAVGKLTIEGTITDQRGDGVALGLLAPYSTIAIGYAGDGSVNTLVTATGDGAVFPAGGLDWAYGEFQSTGTIDCGAGLCSVLGLRIAFTLSPGDNVALTARFDLDAIPTPEPAALALLGLGVIGLAVRRRRAKS